MSVCRDWLADLAAWCLDRVFPPHAPDDAYRVAPDGSRVTAQACRQLAARLRKSV